MSFTQNVLRLPLWLTCEWTFQSRKILRQIFQNLSHRFLATWLGDLFATHSSREIHVFCTIRVIFRAVFKNFHFSLAFCDCSLFCPSLLLPNSPFSHIEPPFSSLFLHQSLRKGIGSVFFSKYFMFLALDFLDCVFLLRFENMMLNMVYGYFVEFDVWVLLVLEV